MSHKAIGKEISLIPAYVLDFMVLFCLKNSIARSCLWFKSINPSTGLIEPLIFLRVTTKNPPQNWIQDPSILIFSSHWSFLGFLCQALQHIGNPSRFGKWWDSFLRIFFQKNHLSGLLAVLRDYWFLSCHQKYWSIWSRNCSNPYGQLRLRQLPLWLPWGTLLSQFFWKPLLG